LQSNLAKMFETLGESQEGLQYEVAELVRTCDIEMASLRSLAHVCKLMPLAHPEEVRYSAGKLFKEGLKATVAAGPAIIHQ